MTPASNYRKWIHLADHAAISLHEYEDLQRKTGQTSCLAAQEALDDARRDAREAGRAAHRFRERAERINYAVSSAFFRALDAGMLHAQRASLSAAACTVASKAWDAASGLTPVELDAAIAASGVVEAALEESHLARRRMRKEWIDYNLDLAARFKSFAAATRANPEANGIELEYAKSGRDLRPFKVRAEEKAASQDAESETHRRRAEKAIREERQILLSEPAMFSRRNRRLNWTPQP